MGRETLARAVACLLMVGQLSACEADNGTPRDTAQPGVDTAGSDASGDDTIVPGGPCAWPGAEGSVVHALVAVKTQADVDLLAGCTEVGSLQIVGAADVTNLDALASLRAVRAWDDVILGGDVLITSNPGLVDVDGLRNLEVAEWGVSITSNDALQRINLASLGQVGTPGEVSSGLAIHTNAVLALLDLGALHWVVNSFSIIGNPALGEVRLGSLAAVLTDSGDLNVGQNARLETLALPSLTSLEGHLTLTDNDGLARLDAPRLESVAGWVGVSGNAALGALDLPLLASPVDAVHVVENPALASISLPSLPSVVDNGWGDTMSDGDVEIGDNALLGSLAFGALTHVDGSLEIFDNPTLPTSQAEQLVEQVTSSGGAGSTSVWGNGPN